MTDFKAKMHQVLFRLGSAPDPAGGSFQRSRRPPSWNWGPLRGRGRGWAGEEEGKGRGRGERGKWREREGPQVTVEPWPLRALLRHYTDLYLRRLYSFAGVNWAIAKILEAWLFPVCPALFGKTCATTQKNVKSHVFLDFEKKRKNT